MYVYTNCLNVTSLYMSCCPLMVAAAYHVFCEKIYVAATIMFFKLHCTYCCYTICIERSVTPLVMGKLECFVQRFTLHGPFLFLW